MFFFFFLRKTTFCLALIQQEQIDPASVSPVFSAANKVAKKKRRLLDTNPAEKPPKPNGLDARTLPGLMSFS